MNLSPIGHFVLRGFILLAIWVILQLNLFGLLDQINDLLTDLLQSLALNLLNLFDFETFQKNNHFGLIGSSGVILGAPCNGLSLMYVYAAFIICVKGKFTVKLLWIVSGMISIQILNLLRILTLLYVNKHFPEALHFNHDYTFTLTIYAMIFFSWYIYMKK